MRALASRFTRNLLLSAGLVALSGTLFALYVRAEAQVDRASELRYRSYVLADELRQSGDDLTRMVRTYVATGDPAYKEYFQEILDIRDGRKPRPENYARPYWDLVLDPGGRPRGGGAAVPLLELMREAGFTDEEFAKLAQAKANSDALTAPELEAMRLLESAGPDAAASRSRAMGMLSDEAYHRAKQSVMQPIDEFFEAVDRRTLAAVQDAEASAAILRNALIAVAAALIFTLWRSYSALNATMGGSVGQVYGAIAGIGRGKSPPASEPGAGAGGAPGSVLAWLEAMKARLDAADRERGQAQESMRREKQLAESLIHSLPGIFYLIGRDTRFLRWNAKFREVTDYSDAEIAGLSPLDLFTGADRERIAQCIHAVFADGQSSAEADLVSKGGGRTPYHFTGILTELEGRPCLIGVGMDITARRQADQALRISEQQFRATFEHAALGVALVSLAGRFDRVNDALCRIVGYTRDELTALTFQQITHPQDLDTDLGFVRRLLAGEMGSYTLEKRYIRKDGSVVWINLTASLVRGDSGEPLYFVAGIEDISARRQAQAALRSIEWMLTPRPAGQAKPASVQPYGDLTRLNTERTILDAVGKELLHDIVSDYMDLLGTSSAVYEKNGDYAYGIFTSGWCQAMDGASRLGCGTDDDARALSCGKWHCHESCWNEASRRSMELRAPNDIACAGGIRLHAVPIMAGDEVIGSINFGYGSPPQDDATLAPLAVKYGLTVEEMRRNAAAYQARPPFIVELAKQRLLGSARLIGEIVQRKRAQAEIDRLNAGLEQRVLERTAQLQAANKDLEGFSYSISHDLRTPLRAVDTFSALLLQEHAGQLDAEGQHLLGVIRTNTARMSRLIDDVLRFSRIGKQDLALATVPMEALAREVIADLQPAGGRPAAFEVSPLPPALADRPLMRLLLQNLLENAVKFAGGRDAPRVTLRGRVENGEALYEVCDNGVGFDPRYAGKLFGVFQRLHAAEEFPGTGIGLAIVKRIVTKHGGRVWAEGRPGAGATFGFSLPRREVRAQGERS